MHLPAASTPVLVLQRISAEAEAEAQVGFGVLLGFFGQAGKNKVKQYNNSVT